MGRFAEASWWWEYGLDGLVGGIAGGVVAWIAVWLTLVGTRRQGETDAAELAVSRRQAAGMRAVLVLTVAQQVRRSVRNDRLVQTFGDLAAALAETRVRTLRRWPLLARELEQIIDDLNARISEPRADAGRHMEQAAVRRSQIATNWMEDPDRYAQTSRWRRRLPRAHLSQP